MNKNRQQTKLIHFFLFLGIATFSLNFLSISKQPVYVLQGKTPSEIRDCKWDCLGKNAECTVSCEYKFQDDLYAVTNCKRECNDKKRDCESYCR